MDSFGHPTGTEAVKKFNEDALKKREDKNGKFMFKENINPAD